jgi:hypothetical protein
MLSVIEGVILVVIVREYIFMINNFGLSAEGSEFFKHIPSADRIGDLYAMSPRNT